MIFCSQTYEVFNLMHYFYDVPEHNAEVMEIYSGRDNYIIQAGTGNPDTVCLFFSSHGILGDGTIESFRKNIVNNDRFEFRNMSRTEPLSSVAGTFVFIRDLFNCWYMDGINSEINSHAKMTEWLKKITDGKRIISIGSSAGGYAAIYFGAQLSAESIYVFSSQMDLTVIGEKTLKSYKYYQEDMNNPEVKDHLSLRETIKSYKGDLYYFYPNKCQFDIDQYEQVKDLENIKIFSMNRDKHGRSVYPPSMIKILCMPKTELDGLYNKFKGKKISAAYFMAITSGYKATVKYLWKQLRK